MRPRLSLNDSKLGDQSIWGLLTKRTTAPILIMKVINMAVIRHSGDVTTTLEMYVIFK